MNNKEKFLDDLKRMGLGEILSLSDNELQMCGENLYHVAERFRKNPFSPKSIRINYYWVYIFIWLLVLLRAKLYYLLFVKNKFNNKIDSQIIVIPTASKYIRMKLLDEIIKDKFAIIYFPEFQFKLFSQHYKYYKERDTQTFFMSIRTKSIIRYLYLSIKYAKCVNKIEKSWRGMGYEPYIFYRFICHYSICRDSFHAFIKSHFVYNEDMVWLFDIPNGERYILAQSFIKEQLKNAFSIHIHHGATPTSNACYKNSIADYNFCCSMRERYLFCGYLDGNKMIPIGAPFQAFENDVDTDLNAEKVDILVLLTDMHTNRANLQKQLVNELNKTTLHVKYRFRPASQMYDRKLLPQIKKDTISNIQSLKQDVYRAKSIITFSEDALYMCLMMNRCTAYLLPQEDLSEMQLLTGHRNKSQLFISDKATDVVEFMQRSHSQNIDYSQDEFVRNNFGELSFDGLKANFISAIKLILEQNG